MCDWGERRCGRIGVSSCVEIHSMSETMHAICAIVCIKKCTIIRSYVCILVSSTLNTLIVLWFEPRVRNLSFRPGGWKSTSIFWFLFARIELRWSKTTSHALCDGIPQQQRILVSSSRFYSSGWEAFEIYFWECVALNWINDNHCIELAWLHRHPFLLWVLYINHIRISTSDAQRTYISLLSTLNPRLFALPEPLHGGRQSVFYPFGNVCPLLPWFGLAFPPLLWVDNLPGIEDCYLKVARDSVVFERDESTCIGSNHQDERKTKWMWWVE